MGYNTTIKKNEVDLYADREGCLIISQKEKTSCTTSPIYILWCHCIMTSAYMETYVRLYVYKKGSEKIYKPLLVVTQRVWFWGEEGAFWITLIVLLYYLKFF